MPTADELREKIATIREFPDRVEAAVKELSKEQLDEPGGEGEWSIKQVVHHLADAHLNAYTRMKLLLTEERPTLKPYDQAAWAELRDTTDLPIQPSLQILRGVHARWSYLLEGVSEDQWGRPGFHPEAGEVTLKGLLDSYVDHCRVHLRQIATILGGS